MAEAERVTERPRKPRPERTSPIRSWSGLADPPAPETGSEAAAAQEAAGAPAPPASATDPQPAATPAPATASEPAATSGAAEGPDSSATSGAATAPEPAPTPGPATGGGDDAPPGDGPPRAVDAGYRVIEEYLSQGRAAAEQMGFGLAGGLAAAGSFQALTARLFRDGLLWMEHLSKLVAAPETADGAPAPAAAKHAAGPADPRILVRVSSRRPAEVDLQLRAPREDRGLGLHALRCPDAAAPPLEDVALERTGGDWRVSVHVADGQPPGLYTGVVYDRRDGSIQGTVAVHVGGELPG